jgi:dCMP deaminase
MEEGKTDYKRPSWDEYFMEIMEAIAKRGTCERGRSGCVIAKDKQIISAGYVGSPIGEDHCDSVGHLFQKRYNADGTFSMHCVRTVHAEQNAICQAAKRGTSIEGATLYCRMTPCPVCAKMIINCGIKRVVCQKRYHDGAEAERLFLRAGISLEHLSEDEEEYSGKGNKTKEKEDIEWRSAPLPDKNEISTTEVRIKIKKLNPETTLPTYAYQNDAGMDLYSTEDIEIPPGSRAKVATGIAIELPAGYASLIWDKSGVSVNKGLKTLGGVIDSGYRGEYFVGFANISKEPVNIQKGEKIAQMLIQKVERPRIEISEDLSESPRGESGFGSTDFKKIDPVDDLGLDYLPDDDEMEEISGEDQESEIIEEIKGEGQDGKSRW